MARFFLAATRATVDKATSKKALYYLNAKTYLDKTRASIVYFL